jgi:uncharacterized membrane-anchored protein
MDRQMDSQSDYYRAPAICEALKNIQCKVLINLSCVLFMWTYLTMVFVEMLDCNLNTLCSPCSSAAAIFSAVIFTTNFTVESV